MYSPVYTLPYAGYGASGFGIPVPTPLPGQSDYAPDMTADKYYAFCGSKYGFQQMLADLGFYGGAIDGDIGSGTLAAAKAFADANGLPWGASLHATYCQKLIDAWQAKIGGGAPAPPPSAPPRIDPKVLRKAARRYLVAKKVDPEPESAPLKKSRSKSEIEQERGGALDKAQAWWGSQSTAVKVGIGVGGAALVGLAIYALVAKPAPAPQPMTANRRRYRRNRTTTRKAARTRARGKRSKAPLGKIMTIKGGRRFGHEIPPKRYWSEGHRRKSDYAWPQGYKYPLVARTATGKIKRGTTQKKCRRALGYFMHKKTRATYPPKVRRTIARNLLRTCPRYINLSQQSVQKLKREIASRG